MSDGPHRCLKMRKPWRAAAHAADSGAFSEGEVEDRVSHALTNDWASEVPIGTVRELRECFGAGEQLSLIVSTVDIAARLHRLAPGSAFVAALADCAEDAVARGLAGDAALQDILHAVLEDRAERSMRHIQEIYQREASDGRARRVIGRISPPLARAVSTLARDILQSGVPIKAAPITRFTGIDEGPQL